MNRKKEPFVVSSDVIDAIVAGEGIDKGFDQKVKRVYSRDIEVRRDIDKTIWRGKKAAKC